MSVVGSAILAALVLATLPLVVVPERCARVRFRHARDPEPTPAGVREMRLAGVVLLGFELVVLATLLL